MIKLVNLKNNEFIKNVTILATGAGIAQVIPLLAAPIVARLYNPVDYAVLAAYSSIAILLTIIATGMFDAAIMLDRNDNDAINTGCVAFIVTMSVTTFSTIAIFMFRSQLTKLTGNEEVKLWLFLVPVTVFCTGCNQILNVWNNRKERYKRLANNKVLITATSTTLTIFFGLLNFHEKGLLLSLLAGQSIAMLLLLFQTISNDRLLLSFISKNEIKKSIIRHKDFPKYNMPQGMLDGIKEGSIIWIISNFFGANILGSFSFAKNILMKPFLLIASSFNQVFYRKASKLYNDGFSIYNFSKNNFFMLFAIGLPFTIIIGIWGKEIFSFIFSNKWEKAGNISQVLMPWLLFSFVASAISTIPLILKKQRVFFYFSLLFNTIPLFVLYLLGYLEVSYEKALSYFVSTNILFYIILFAWYKHIMQLTNSRQ